MMQIVADRGMDLAPKQMEGFSIHLVPLRITLEGKTYASGIDLQSEDFYRMLAETGAMPITSQPSPGEFAELYREIAKTDPDILSIHMSSGLSGTYNAARTGAEMVPEANVTLVDSKTLSVPLGWQVEAAARALRAGWSLDRVLELVRQVRKHSEGYFTLQNLNYLIHGGRISHLKGLMASLLNIKPVIGVDEDSGKYVTMGQEITLKRAMRKLVDVVAARFPGEKTLRVQLLHGQNPEGVEQLKNLLLERFECILEPTVRIAPVLGAHTGPTMIGLGVGPASFFRDLPA